jgi:type I restriction enzyme, S subunit
MNRVTLGDVCKKASSNIAQKDLNGNEGEYPIYGASGYIKTVDFYHQEEPYIAIVKDGAGIGRTMLLPAKSSVIGTMQYILLKEDKSVDLDYLYYAIVHMNLGKYFSGATIPHIYFKDYQKEPLNLPDMHEQQQIASIFKKIDALISGRKEQIEQLDEIIKSRFIELFGDPILNDKLFPTLSGENLFKLSNGKAVPDEKRLEAGVPAYGGNGISWYTDEFLMAEDTIVVGRVGFQSGNVHYAVGPLWITDNAMYISRYEKDKLNLIFLCELMQHVNFSRYQDAGDLKKITQKPFMSFKYILPSMKLQQQFVDFKNEVDKSKHFSELEVAA